MCCGAGTDCVRSRWTRITVIAGTRRAVARAHAVRWRICGAGVPSFRGVAAERRVAGAGEHIDVGIPVGAGVEDAVGGGLVRMRPVLLELGAVEVDVLAAWWGSRGSSPDEPSQVEHRIRRASHHHRLAWFTCPVASGHCWSYSRRKPRPLCPALRTTSAVVRREVVHAVGLTTC